MRFVADNSQLTIELEGREQIWALKSKIVVLKNQLITVQYKDYFKDWHKWEVRMPGTGMPGKLIAGSFWTESGWDFLYLKNPQGWLNPIVRNVLYIETNQQKFRRIILSCSASQAQEIVLWASA